MNVEACIESYRRDGYARLGRIVDDATLTSLRERTEDLMLGRVVLPGLFFQMDAENGDYRDAPLGKGWQGPSLGYRKLEKLELDERFRALIQEPQLEPLVRGLIPGGVVLYRAIVFSKGAATGGSEIPWHQDAGKLWGLSRDPEVQIWTALDDAPEGQGCLEVVPGSHRWGLSTPLGGVVPENVVAERNVEPLRISLPVKAGESVLLHNLVWHRSGRTPLGQRRLGFSACYMSDQTRCVRKHKTPRTFFSVFTG